MIFAAALGQTMARAGEPVQTGIATLRCHERPACLVADERIARLPWPAMVESFDKHVDRYGGMAFFDATGIGMVVADLAVNRIRRGFARLPMKATGLSFVPRWVRTAWSDISVRLLVSEGYKTNAAVWACVRVWSRGFTVPRFLADAGRVIRPATRRRTVTVGTSCSRSRTRSGSLQSASPGTTSWPSCTTPPAQRSMIAEVNAALVPRLVTVDGVRRILFA